MGATCSPNRFARAATSEGATTCSPSIRSEGLHGAVAPKAGGGGGEMGFGPTGTLPRPAGVQVRCLRPPGHPSAGEPLAWRPFGRAGVMRPTPLRQD